MSKQIVIGLFLALSCCIFSQSNQIIADTLPAKSIESSSIRSVFAEHDLQPIHSTPIFNPEHVYYWPSIVFFLVLILFVSIKITDPIKLNRVFVSTFSLQAAKQLFREDYKLNKRVSVFLSISFITVMAFLIYIINNYFGLILHDVYSLYQFLFFLLIVVLTYIVKLGGNYLLSLLTANIDLGKEYIFNVFVFSQTIGIILFPIIICIQYTKYPPEWFLYPGLVACLLFYVLRMVRVIAFSALEQGVGILYIFLYLCALEVLPFLVLIKFVLVNF